jgi:hypothetical protein
MARARTVGRSAVSVSIAAAILGKMRSPAKTKAARRNGRLGGRPPKKKPLTEAK